MYRWTEAFPGRLEAELAAFEADDRLDFELDEEERKRTGRIRLGGTLLHKGGKIKLEIRYPESFPFLRPEVFAPELRLARHQNPTRGNLCLLDRSSLAWNPSDTGAWLVGERVPYLLDLLEKGGEEMAAAEVPQGEPHSVWFPPAAGSIVFVPDDFLKLRADCTAGVARLSVHPQEEHGQLLRACLSHVAVADKKGRKQPIASVQDQRLRERFPKTAFEVAWVRLDELPAGEGKAGELLEAIRQRPGYKAPPWQRMPWGQMRISGALFSEEVRQGQEGDDWLFVVEVKVNDGGTAYVTHVDRLSAEDLAERIPRLAGLQAKSVALAGLGALGAPLALELSRCQVGNLRTLDDDQVETGTIVRWPHGLYAAGHPKTQVIEDWLRVGYPFTTPSTTLLRIGQIPMPTEPEPRSEIEQLDGFLDGADLLVDATAEVGVQQFLAHLADQRSLNQVYVWMTEGGWGGAVARVIPGQTGCWRCLQLRLADGSIPLPPLEETGTVQPRGCATRTFTGSSFEALSVVSQAARVVTHTLIHGRNGGPDVFICDQAVGPEDRLLAPNWKSFSLDPHPDCNCEGAKP